MPKPEPSGYVRWSMRNKMSGYSQWHYTRGTHHSTLCGVFTSSGKELERVYEIPQEEVCKSCIRVLARLVQANDQRRG